MGVVWGLLCLHPNTIKPRYLMVLYNATYAGYVCGYVYLMVYSYNAACWVCLLPHLSNGCEMDIHPI